MITRTTNGCDANTTTVADDDTTDGCDIDNPTAAADDTTNGWDINTMNVADHDMMNSCDVNTTTVADDDMTNGITAVIPDLFIDGVKAERAAEYKYLGTVSDNKLNF